jgi:hypothetical protein
MSGRSEFKIAVKELANDLALAVPTGAGEFMLGRTGTRKPLRKVVKEGHYIGERE